MKMFWAGIALGAVLLASPAMAGGNDNNNGGQGGGAPNVAVSTSSSGSQSAAGAVSTSSPVVTTSASSDAATAGNSQTINNNQITPSTQTLRSAPQVFAPALTTTLTETCMGSTSLGVSVIGWGATGGTTWNDGECVRRLNARELNSMGFRAEACYVLRMDRDVEAAFQKTGGSCLPQAVAQVMAPPPPPPPPPAAAPPPPPPPAPAPVAHGFRQIEQDSDS
jgi:hypothetical protein